jgi:hypothetical protein
MSERATPSDIAKAYMSTSLQEERRGVSEDALKDMGYETYDEARAILNEVQTAQPKLKASPRVIAPPRPSQPSDSHSEFEAPADWRLSSEHRKVGKAALKLIKKNLQE